LHDKLLKLPDETEIFPAHGAGSLCGRQMGSERSSTIGNERRFNYALQARSCDEFVRLLTDGMPSRPEYFIRDVEMNRQGATPLDSIPQPLTVRAPDVFLLKSDYDVSLDTQSAYDFVFAHITSP